MKKIPLPTRPTFLALLFIPIAAAALLLASQRSTPPPATPGEAPEPIAEKATSILAQLPKIIAPAPTPRSEKDEAIHQLSLLGLEPTASALSKLLETPEADPRIDLFLKAGVNTNATDPSGRPLLVTACGIGRTKEAIALLEAGANPDTTTPEGLNAFMAAARAGQLELLKLLIDRGVAASTADTSGHTALHHAILGGHPEIATFLISTGIQPSACCHGEKTLSLHALEMKDPAALEAALSVEKPDAWHPTLANTLLEAARTGDKAMVRLLIAHHEAAPPHPECRHPLLGYAIAWGDHNMLRLLLECGADPNALLGSPVESTFADLVPQKFMRYYLGREAGITPLMLAAGRGDTEAVGVLLEHGAKRNALTQKSRWPAISFAAQSGNTDVMQLLLGKTLLPDEEQMRIEISLSSQTAKLWRNNELSLTTRISTGRSGYRTPAGRYVITDKSRNRMSSIYRVNMPHFMRLNCSAIGMHAGHVPGYPASHGCIRLPSGMAAKLFQEVPVGTLVIIR